MSRGETLGVVGAGRFGTALANLVAGTGRDVVLLTSNEAVAAEINASHTNNARLPRVQLAVTLRATTDPGDLARSTRFIVLAVASTEVAERARALGDHCDGSHIVVHANGALAAPSDRRVSEVLRELMPVRRVGVLAGPALPNDLVRRQFASMVVASSFDEVTMEGRRLLGVPPVLRVYRGTDLVGVELAAALSGAHTVALAMADAMDIGPGPRAVMVTRAVAEASRLGEAVGADPRTFAGLAGLGNLLVRTTPEAKARDYLLGLELGRRGVVPGGKQTEGVRAAAAGVRLADRYRVHVPLLRGVDAVVRGELDPAEAGRAVADSVAAEE
jgi:glycerol-3-phosphate dehydrogenase (NAD(P)+)